MSVTRDEHDGEADGDRLFLDRVLNKLYDFGEGKNKGLKKSQKRKNAPEDTDSEQLMTNPTVCENMPSGAKQSSVEVVTFIDPLKKNKISKVVEPGQKVPDVKGKKKTGTDEKLAIEKARFEVHKFGLSGYQKQQQRAFEQDRAIMLGARPPKKQHVNYKMYQQMIKEQKMKAKEEAKSETQKKRRKEGKPRTEKSKSSSSGELGGQVGRFKNGMLVLSSKDIQKLKVKINGKTDLRNNLSFLSKLSMR
uniref:Zgc:194224 n=1 Tax=Cyprinus carpio TaxID=7962 RepID=A0A8C1UF08_CYPCA